MQSTGIIRRIDDLGRLVVPKDVRYKLGIKEGDALEIFYDGDMIIFKKYSDNGLLVSALERVSSLINDKVASLGLSVVEKEIMNSMINFVLTKLNSGENPLD